MFIRGAAPAGETSSSAGSVTGVSAGAAGVTAAAAGAAVAAGAAGVTAGAATATAAGGIAGAAGAAGAGAAGSLALVSPSVPPPPDLPVLTCPRRPNLGHEGRPIMLRANHFQISMPRGFVHHYDVTIQPDKCPRKVSSSCYFSITTDAENYLGLMN